MYGRRLSGWSCSLSLLLVSFLTVVLIQPASGSERPDVLLIMVDDLRPMLGCYQHPHVKSPNFDRLAERAVVFEHAYCQYAKCGPSRLSLMTGLRPDSVQVFGHRDQEVIDFRKRRPDAVSAAGWLKQHGYETRSFGKIDHDGWANAADWSEPVAPGRPGEILEIADPADASRPTIIAERLDCPAIQSPDVADEHLFAGRMTGQILDVLQNRTGNQPLFLAVGYRRPHLPLVAPQKYFDLYEPDVSWLAVNPLPAKDSPVMAWFNSDGYVGTARRIGLTMPSRPNRQEAITWNGYELRSYQGVPPQGEIPQLLQMRILQAYAACISYVDAQIGRLLDELERSERLEQTVIILCSDHGWHLGEQSAWSKMTNFEVATRVPLLIAAPGIEPGRSNMVTELVDLYPTICDLTGLPHPAHLAGESLIGELQEPGSGLQKTACSQHARFSNRYMGRALRTEQFRFVLWTETESGKVIHRELYDHKKDPHETLNVADVSEYAEQIRQLEEQYRKSFSP